jgi:hypothetical protein
MSDNLLFNSPLYYNPRAKPVRDSSCILKVLTTHKFFIMQIIQKGTNFPILTFWGDKKKVYKALIYFFFFLIFFFSLFNPPLLTLITFHWFPILYLYISLFLSLHTLIHYIHRHLYIVQK